MKNLFLKILISVFSIILLFSFLEWGTRFLENKNLKKFKSAPNSAEEFGNFEGMLKYGKELGYIQDYKYGNAGMFSPYVNIALKPSFSFKIKNKNIDQTTNSFGLRDKEIIMPKPKEVYRIFILGGSTVYGGFNEKWTISYYLENSLKEKYSNIEVFNAGVVGYSSQNELIQLQTKILDLDPDMVIVFDGRNDLYYSSLFNWEPRKEQYYLEQQRILNNLVNYPDGYYILTYAAKILVKESKFLTKVFRSIFRNELLPRVYFENAIIKDKAVAVYLDNWRLMKAILEEKNIKGIFVFQPTMGYCKENLSDYELSVVKYFKEIEKTNWFEEVKKVWPKVSLSVRTMPDFNNIKFYDMSCLFENWQKTAYIDSVHYVPESYRAIGEELAKIIEK